MSKLSIRDLELNNKYLFVRVDFNVPLSDSGLQILDDTRIKETLPTLKYALRHHAEVRAGTNQSFFEHAYVVDRTKIWAFFAGPVTSQIKDGIAHELSWTVISNIAAAVDLV